MFGTLQDRLIKELAKAGIANIAAANAFIRDVYLPAHNSRFARPAALPESAFVAADAALLAETLCIEDERVVARDNTVASDGRRLQLPASPARVHHVKAKVKLRQYPDGTLVSRFRRSYHFAACPITNVGSKGTLAGKAHRKRSVALPRLPALAGPRGASDTPGTAGALRLSWRRGSERGRAEHDCICQWRITMGLLGSLGLGGGIEGALGQVEAAALPALINTVLAKTQYRDLNGRVTALQHGGLETQVQSWLGSGANLPITEDELKSALGNAEVQEFARHLGLPVDQTLKALAQYLPDIVDKALPNGTLQPSS